MTWASSVERINEGCVTYMYIKLIIDSRLGLVSFDESRGNMKVSSERTAAPCTDLCSRHVTTSIVCV